MHVTANQTKVKGVRVVLTVSQNPALGAGNAGVSHSPVNMERSWWRERKSQEKKKFSLAKKKKNPKFLYIYILLTTYDKNIMSPFQ